MFPSRKNGTTNTGCFRFCGKVQLHERYAARRNTRCTWTADHVAPLRVVKPSRFSASAIPRRLVSCFRSDRMIGRTSAYSETAFVRFASWPRARPSAATLRVRFGRSPRAFRAVPPSRTPRCFAAPVLRKPARTHDRARISGGADADRSTRPSGMPQTTRLRGLGTHGSPLPSVLGRGLRLKRSWGSERLSGVDLILGQASHRARVCQARGQAPFAICAADEFIVADHGFVEVNRQDHLGRRCALVLVERTVREKHALKFDGRKAVTAPRVAKAVAKDCDGRTGRGRVVERHAVAARCRYKVARPMLNERATCVDERPSANGCRCCKADISGF